MRCAICYHLYNLKQKNRGVLLLVKLQAKAGTKSRNASHRYSLKINYLLQKVNFV